MNLLGELCPENTTGRFILPQIKNLPNFGQPVGTHPLKYYKACAPGRPVEKKKNRRGLIDRDYNGNAPISYVYQMPGTPPVLPRQGADQVLPGTHLDDPGRCSAVPRLHFQHWQLLPPVDRTVAGWETGQFSSPNYTVYWKAIQC
jgi:hypothetical protein